MKSHQPVNQIKDRILLVGENLISTKEDALEQDFEIKKQLKNIDFQIKSIKQIMNRIVGELPNFSRKSELAILERQMEMFQPLELARMKDVKKIVKEEIKKFKENKSASKTDLQKK